MLPQAVLVPSCALESPKISAKVGPACKLGLWQNQQPTCWSIGPRPVTAALDVGRRKEHSTRDGCADPPAERQGCADRARSASFSFWPRGDIPHYALSGGPLHSGAECRTDWHSLCRLSACDGRAKLRARGLVMLRMLWDCDYTGDDLPTEPCSPTPLLRHKAPASTQEGAYDNKGMVQIRTYSNMRLALNLMEKQEATKHNQDRQESCTVLGAPKSGPRAKKPNSDANLTCSSRGAPWPKSAARDSRPHNPNGKM